MRRWIGSSALAIGALCAAGLVYAQQAPAPPPVLDLLGPDGPIETSPPEETSDELDPALIEAPPSEEAAAAPPPSQALVAEEDRASLEVAAEVAEEIPLEELEPPPPPPAPLKRPRVQSATLMAVDKITAETIRFEAQVGKPVRFKALVFTLRACETSAPDEVIKDEIAFLEVVSNPLPIAGRPTPPARDVYKGWAFASSPALHPIEHPNFDAWLVGCGRVEPREVARLAGGDKVAAATPARGERRRAPRRAPRAASPAPSVTPDLPSGET